MNPTIDLRRLPDAQTAAPFDFEEFERRVAADGRRRRATLWSSAASAGTLGVVALLALMTQVRQPVAVFTGSPSAAVSGAADIPYEPAVVDVGRFEVTSEIEDHIALLDAQISAARVYAAPPERLRQMETTRAQLNESLQRVSYAQALLSF
jgi:hypothetical protein